MIELHHGDCLEVMKAIPDGSIDCVITDCPYHIVSGGITIEDNGNEPSGILRRRGCGKCSKKWETIGQISNIENAKSGKLFDNNDIAFEDWLPEVYRVLKNNSHCYIMINSRNLCELQTKAEKVGFKFQNLLVWDKGNATPNKWYMQGLEFILMLRKGKAVQINNMGEKNIFRVPNIIGKKVHPTEKPEKLMSIMVENSTNKNETVLDPFMGAGSTGLACKHNGRSFIGIEIDEKYYKIAEERINGELL